MYWQFWVCLLILTSHNDTCKIRDVLGSLAIFLQNESIVCYSARTTSFVDKTSHEDLVRLSGARLKT
jgi:hypothetical protein